METKKLSGNYTKKIIAYLEFQSGTKLIELKSKTVESGFNEIKREYLQDGDKKLLNVTVFKVNRCVPLTTEEWYKEKAIKTAKELAKKSDMIERLIKVKNKLDEIEKHSS